MRCGLLAWGREELTLPEERAASRRIFLPEENSGLPGGVFCSVSLGITRVRLTSHRRGSRHPPPPGLSEGGGERMLRMERIPGWHRARAESCIATHTL